MVNIFPLGSTKVFDNGVEVVTPAPGMHRHVRANGQCMGDSAYCYLEAC